MLAQKLYNRYFHIFSGEPENYSLIFWFEMILYVYSFSSVENTLNIIEKESLLKRKICTQLDFDPLLFCAKKEG